MKIESNNSKKYQGKNENHEMYCLCIALESSYFVPKNNINREPLFQLLIRLLQNSVPKGFHPVSFTLNLRSFLAIPFEHVVAGIKIVYSCHYTAGNTGMTKSWSLIPSTK